MAEPTIGAGVAQGLLDYAATRGATRRELAMRCGIDAEALQDPDAERFVIRRQGGRIWMIDTRKNPNDFPEMTDSSFGRIVCSFRRWFDGDCFVRAVHVTHPDPAPRAR